MTPEELERQRQQTGVAQGGTGYVSGQVAPTGQAMAALGVAPAGGAPGTPRTGTTSATTPTSGPIGRPQSGGTTTTMGALTAPTAGTPRTPAPAPPPGDTTTTTSALTSFGGAGPQPTNTGTTRGPSAVPLGENASPTVWGLNQVQPGLGDKFDPGSKLVGNYLTPTMADLSPALASQRAGFGLSDDLSSERYDYRPGAAASQEGVTLDRTDATQIRGGQQRALEALGAAARGEVPSAAELQMRREAGRNVAATLGQARALGGRSAGGAARAGTLASADILARNSTEGAALRAAEQDRARQAEMQALGMVRGQDEDASLAQGRLTQEQRQNNLRAQVEQNELAERHRQMLLQGQLQALGIGTGAGNAAVGASQANAAAANKFQGGIMDIGAGLLGGA